MDQTSLTTALANLSLGTIRYFDTLGSTNSKAAAWAENDAPDLALVVANEQTEGRGRSGRKWFTPADAALAFSLVLRNQEAARSEVLSPAPIVRLTALGALAICQALRLDYNLPAVIKWPNDVLINQRKVAGVLAEALWTGDVLSAVILGIGINVAPESVPSDRELAFPATCLQDAISRPLSRLELLRAILIQMLKWRDLLNEPDFIQAWEDLLAYRGQSVEIISGDKDQYATQGELIGIDQLGCLKLRDQTGKMFTILSGSMRPLPVSKEAYQQ